MVLLLTLPAPLAWGWTLVAHPEKKSRGGIGV